QAEALVRPSLRLRHVSPDGAPAARHRLRRLLDRGESVPRGHRATLHRPDQRGLVLRDRDVLPHQTGGRPYRADSGAVRGLAEVEVQPAARGDLQVQSPLRPVDEGPPHAGSVTIDPSGADLEAEARVFARYLVDAPPAPEVIDRYRAAIATLWPTPP